MVKAVIFDLDGTLINTLPDIAASMNRTLRSFGLPEHPEDAYKLMVGNGAHILTERAVGPRTELTEQVYAAYREDYAANNRVLSQPYEGITALLMELDRRGIQTAVFSNKDHQDVLTVIQYYFPQMQFAALRGRQPGIPIKPAPDGAFRIAEALRLRPEDFLYAGDTGVDMDCGRSAGMVTVGVSWGFRSREELQKHQACHIIDRPDEMLTLISRC